jgi:hypothetical protein
MAVNSLQKQREGSIGRPFPKGQSGNPAGRTPGTRNRSTIAAEVLLEGEAEALTRRAIECAMEGDVTALRLCLERVVPRRKSRPLALELPPLNGPEDLTRAIGSVLQEVAQGGLLLDEGAALVGMMESQRKAMETIDLESRLRALESRTQVDNLQQEGGQ